jgi:hypothetical protein
MLQNNLNIDRLWEYGEKWRDRFNSFWPEGVRLRAYGTRGVFEGDPLAKALFFQESVLAGLLFGPSWFISFAHLSIDDSYMKTIEEILCRIRKGQVSLKGQMPQSPFSQKVRKM